MTKRAQLIALLTAVSLLGVFCLQAYFGWQVFLQHTATLVQQVDTALQEAVEAADKDRVARINHYFAADLRNPEFAKLSLCPQDNRPAICVRDPQNNDLRVSFLYTADSSFTATNEELVAKVVAQNTSSLAEGMVIYWTDTIGSRLTAYKDTVGIAQEYLAERLRSELALRQINTEFQLVFTEDSLVTLAPGANQLLSQTVAASLVGQSAVAVLMDNPGRVVLRRLSVVLLLTVLVLSLVGASFWFLWWLLNRQRKLAQLKDDFIDNVTHELITPVAVLKLALETLRNQAGIPQASRYLSMLEQQTQRIAEVVDHILQVSFVEQLKPGLRLESLQPGPLLEEVLTYYRHTVRKPLKINFAQESHLGVWSDRHHLINVFHNLVGNAIKYAPDSGAKVDILLREEAENLSILISDNGTGIPPAEQERIFEKFHRVATGDTHEVKGLGIGLYYARGILRQLRGDLQLLRSSATGSTFAITLPKDQTDEL